MTYDILDCTLRDGGYYNNWDFEDELVRTYITNVAKLPISTIEVGYCSLPSDGYKGEWAYLRRERLSEVKSRLRPDQSLGIMLDAKECQPTDIPALVGSLVGVVDIVRMAVAPTQFIHGITLAKELKRLGFKVGFNTMYLSTYSADLEVLSPILAGRDSVDVLALVDSYGGCTPAQVTAHVTNARAMFSGVMIGFHGHDNTCLGYANALAAAEAGAQVVDATFVGMGRGAGNTRTEMLLVHKASSGVDVDFDAAAEVVDRFEMLRDEYRWGTNLPYMISGSANLPQKDVMDWLGKNRYSPVSVIRALQNQSTSVVDTLNFPELGPDSLPSRANETVLIIGGGPSVRRHREALERFAAANSVCVVHANTRHLDLIETLSPDQIVCLPGNAAAKLPEGINPRNIAGFVTSPPPRFRGAAPDDLGKPMFQTAPFGTANPGDLGPVSDIGPLSLALGAALGLRAKRIYLVGFDGYANANVAQQELAQEIQQSINRIMDDGIVEIVSLTPTLYNLPVQSIYSV